MTRSSLPFGMRWSNCLERRRYGWRNWMEDAVYLISGFYL